jgi:hypothetical protein
LTAAATGTKLTNEIIVNISKKLALVKVQSHRNLGMTRIIFDLDL